MSKNFEQNFSLKDWVTNRAANMPETVEEETVLQVQNGVDIIMRSEKLIVPEKQRAEPKMTTTEAADEASSESEEQKPSKISARIASGLSAAPAVPTSPAQQIQIVRLLRDLGDRLRQSEKEREILWRELDSCRKILTDIEDKTSKTEQAYLSLETKLNAPQTPGVAEESEEAKEFRKNISDKITALETTTGSAVLRLEDAISENAKLSRRLEQVTQERAQLLGKIEEIQETLSETQDTLRAKALVLLTDNALANKTSLPQAPAWSGNDTLRMQEAPAKPTVMDEVFGTENQPWWKTQSSKKMTGSRIALVSFIVLGIAGGFAMTKYDAPSAFFKPVLTSPVETAKVPVPPSDVTTPPVQAPAAAPEQKAAVTDEQAHMNEMAQLANQIEPGNPEPNAAEQALEADAPTTAGIAEAKAKDIFTAEAPQGTVASRIKADASLPANVKAIETKAFAGDAEAQHDLAAIYTAGHAGVKTNYTKAAEWFTEAAHNNIANAQYNLAVLYHQGLGVKQDTKRAIDLYRIAASNNHPEAQYNLGIAHIEGIGADYNPQIAAHYFQRAAEGGVVEAAYNMGLIEENGLLGEAQPDEAIFWYKLALNRGNTQAKEALAQLSRQLGMTEAQLNAAFKRVSAEKPEAVKALAPPAAVPKPVAATPKAAAPAPVKTAVATTKAADSKPVPLGTPSTSFDPVIVAQIQEQLIRLGLYSGSADGTADKATQEAVRSYQSKNKMKVDGKPSEDVLVHMLASELQVEPAAGKAN